MSSASRRSRSLPVTVRRGALVALVGSALAGGAFVGAAPARAHAQQQRGGVDASPIVLTRANVIDGSGAAPITDATVVLVGGKVERVARGAVAPPAGARVIDVGGRWVLPGMIDAHTHIASLASARRALESGVTTVRSASVGAFQDIGLRELARIGAIAGPDVVAAGMFVTPELGESALGDPRLAAIAQPVTTPEGLRALVRVNLDRGVDVIKTRGTERAGLPNTDPRKQTYDEAQLRAVVEEAATRRIPVMAHAHGDEGARAAVRAGVRSIEHGTYLADSMDHDRFYRGAEGDSPNNIGNPDRDVGLPAYIPTETWFGNHPYAKPGEDTWGDDAFQYLDQEGGFNFRHNSRQVLNGAFSDGSVRTMRSYMKIPHPGDATFATSDVERAMLRPKYPNPLARAAS